jgi:hypothetical protein
MHTHKGKRQTEKQTSAITSNKYRRMFEKKRVAKDAEESAETETKNNNYNEVPKMETFHTK